jgi:predicted DNA-binding transcriptional regulator YafY/uncharacterized protein YndB with AHSA1/START domain
VRADRLVAILLMLQSRGQVTAAEVAEELEVSERTARRDLDALGMAGLPIYSRQGRNGGWQLAGGGRTDLSGLTASEARALFLVAGPSSSATPEVRAALRKLVRALPESFRTQAEAASAAVVVDPAGWDRPAHPRRSPPLLDTVQRAVVEGQQVTLGYRARDGAVSSRVVHPLGLAAKGTAWYLVAGTDAGLRTFRVDRMTAVEPTGEPAVRPDGFDLTEAWRLIIDEVDKRRTPLVARALVRPDAVWICRSVFANRVQIGPTVDDGRVEVELRGHSAFSLAAEIAGLGAMVEVLDPAEVRECLTRAGAELVAQYADDVLVVHEAVVVPAPRPAVWGAFVDPVGRARWWPYLHVDPTPGGRMEERWTDPHGHEVLTSGQVVEVVAPRLLRLTWSDDGWPAATEVELRLEPQRRGTLVSVRHAGWASLPDAQRLVADHRAGWRAHLDDLRALFAGVPSVAGDEEAG